VAFAWKATGILHNAPAPDGQAGRQAAGAVSGSPAKGVAGVVSRFVAGIAAEIVEELRIRRDMRQLKAIDDYILKNMGLMRANIGGGALEPGLMRPAVSAKANRPAPLRSLRAQLR
jgi:hypothetical protein